MGRPQAFSREELLWRSPAERSEGGRRARFSVLLARELGVVTASFRFRAAAVSTLVLLVLSSLVFSGRYRAELAARESILDAYEEKIAGVALNRVITYQHPALKAPWKLAFLVDGGQATSPDLYQQSLSVWTPPALGRSYYSNDYLWDRLPLDWLFVASTLLALGAFVLGHDAVCGKSNREALRLVLSYPLDRRRILGAKFLALWLGLSVPFLLGGIVALAVLWGYGGLRFSQAEGGRIVLLALFCLWVLALWTLTALVASVRSGKAAHCLVVLAILWLAAAEAIPAASILVAQGLRPVLPQQELESRLAEIHQRFFEKSGSIWRQLAIARTDGFARERVSAQNENLRFGQQERLRREELGRKLKQVELARRLSFLSPIALARDTAEQLAGTGPGRDKRFLDQAWAFRERMAEQARRLDAEDPDSPHLLFFDRYMSRRPIDAATWPRFEPRDPTLGESLREATPNLLLMIAISILVTLLAVWSFERYEVG